MNTRIEKDSMGEMPVPENAKYGASTARAVINFPISGTPMPRAFIKALGAVKVGCASANEALGLLDATSSELIRRGAQSVSVGEQDDHFVVDVYQTGSGTSSNMNANEVIAYLCNHEYGAPSKIHPNDHVNMSQSSNDVIPSAIAIAAVIEAEQSLLPALKKMIAKLDEKAEKFKTVLKSGRTHLQDATPITVGQEFSGYKMQVALAAKRIEEALKECRFLALGGTAVGTGINTHPEFPKKAIKFISEFVGSDFYESENHFATQSAQDHIVQLSGTLKTLATALYKIANDIRWLSCGPRCGIGELTIPAVQPGSSIMPAKVNPVIVESLLMVCAQVIGLDAAITMGGHQGNFQLNVMLPMIGDNVLKMIQLLSNSAVNFTDRCIDGIEVVEEKCRYNAEASLATCTSLAPIIGYDKAAKLAKIAYEKNKTIIEMLRDTETLGKLEISKTSDELLRAMDLLAMTKPGV